MSATACVQSADHDTTKLFVPELPGLLIHYLISIAPKMSTSKSSIESREQLKTGIAKAILAAVPFDEEKTRVMDYACGTGAISQRLAPFCKQLVGIDISSKVVEEYNRKVSDQGIPSEEMIAICADLSQTPEILNNELFDIVICSQAYHHFPSIDTTTKLLTSFLKPGGHLLVADLLKSNHSHLFHSHKRHDHDGERAKSDCKAHDHQHGEKEAALLSPVIHHGGITEEQTIGAFQSAGLVEVDFTIIHTLQKGGDEIEIFLAKGDRKSVV